MALLALLCTQSAANPTHPVGTLSTGCFNGANVPVPCAELYTGPGFNPGNADAGSVFDYGRGKAPGIGDGNKRTAKSNESFNPSNYNLHKIRTKNYGGEGSFFTKISL